MEAIKPQKTGIKWLAIVLALMAITAGRIIKYAVFGEHNETRKSEFVDSKTLGVELSVNSIMLDVHGDGRIVLDGKSVTWEEVDRKLADWKKAGRVLSIYTEKNAESPNAAVSTVTTAIIKDRLSFSPRIIPQYIEGEQGADGNRTQAPQSLDKH